MAYPEGFWSFVDRDGHVYGSLAVAHETAQQAWADFYDGPVKERRAAEAAGCYCRPAQAGDLDEMRSRI
jgi:hypothetical protein